MQLSASVRLLLLCWRSFGATVAPGRLNIIVVFGGFDVTDLWRTSTVPKTESSREYIREIATINTNIHEEWDKKRARLMTAIKSTLALKAPHPHLYEFVGRSSD